MYSDLSREVIKTYLSNELMDEEKLQKCIEAKNPIAFKTKYHALIASAFGAKDLNALDLLIREIEGGDRGLPPLMRYYSLLGAKFLAFHIEPSFKNSLYCFLRVHVPRHGAALA